MESQLGIVLREQQAFLSLLLTRVALVDGDERRTAFETLKHALFAHLAEWRCVLLPKAGDTQLARQTAASGRLVAARVWSACAGQQGVGANNDIQALITSVLSLLSHESALLRTTFSALPHAIQMALATEAEDAFIRLGGTAEFDALRTQCEGAERSTRGQSGDPPEEQRPHGEHPSRGLAAPCPGQQDPKRPGAPRSR